MKKDFQIMKKGSQVSKAGKNDGNDNISATTYPNHAFLTGDSMSGSGEGSGIGPGAQKRWKNRKSSGFRPFGAGYPSGNFL